MAKALKIRKAYEKFYALKTINMDPSLTEQSHKDSCDINKIMARFQKTGTINHLNKYGPMYGDIPSIDLLTAMETTKKANNMFDELPSAIRNKFENEPGLFLDFVQDPANKSEMVELGLAKAENKPKNEQKPEVVPEPVEPE